LKAQNSSENKQDKFGSAMSEPDLVTREMFLAIAGFATSLGGLIVALFVPVHGEFLIMRPLVFEPRNRSWITKVCIRSSRTYEI